MTKRIIHFTGYFVFTYLVIIYLYIKGLIKAKPFGKRISLWVIGIGIAAASVIDPLVLKAVNVSLVIGSAYNAYAEIKLECEED